MHFNLTSSMGSGIIITERRKGVDMMTEIFRNGDVDDMIFGDMATVPSDR